MTWPTYTQRGSVTTCDACGARTPRKWQQKARHSMDHWVLVGRAGQGKAA
jgi:hypothetical protein